MAESLGMDCVLKFDGVEVTNCLNLDLGQDKAVTDVTKRGNNGFRAQRTTLKEVTISWEMIYDAADANFTAIKAAYDNNTENTVLVEDDAGGEIVEATGYVKTFNVSQPLEEASKVNVEFIVSEIL